MNRDSEIRVVFFDAAGTLLHLPKGVGYHYREVALRHGIDIPAATLERAFGKAWKKAPSPPLTREQRPDDDRGWWRDLVEEVLALCGASGLGDIEALFGDLYSEFIRPGVWELYPEAREVLEQLRENYRLGIISNFDGRLRLILQDLGVAEYFDPWVISSEVGADKPAPYIYECALEMAGIGPAEALHVGDDPEGDWAAAADAGLHVFKLDRPRNSLRDLVADLVPSGCPPNA